MELSFGNPVLANEMVSHWFRARHPPSNKDALALVAEGVTDAEQLLPLTAPAFGERKRTAIVRPGQWTS
jgi:hypothetical protein